jgi:hypothetical protein
MSGGGTPRMLRSLQWALVAVGVLLRLRQYLHARPVWLDEAMLLSNILGRSFGDLLQPLDSDQTAPVPFLWAVRLCAVLGGTDERVLRLVPFLAGVGLLVAVLCVARRLLAPGAATLAVLLVALSPMLIYFANEVKPYGVDACAFALLALLTARLAERPDLRDRWAALLAVGAVVAVSSATAPFMLAGVGAALVLAPEVRRAPAAVAWLAAMALLWGGAFAAEYLLVYRAASGSAYMQRFWTPYFLSPTLPGLAGKAVAAAVEGMESWFLAPGGGWRAVVAGALVLPLGLGAWTLARGRGVWAVALMLVPVFGALAASVVRAYPVAPRLLLFVVPGLAVLLAAGTEAVCAWLTRRWPVAWLAAAGVGLAFLPGLDAARQLAEPYEREATRPLVERFRREHAPGAAIYVFGRGMPAWLFYSTDWRAPDLARVRERIALVSSTGAAFRNAASRGRPVAAEGDTLRFAVGDWRELVGVPTGTGPDSLGIPSPAPDSGWADNEARRLHEAGGPEAWVLLSSFQPMVPDQLDAALTRRGGVRALREERPGAVLMRWTFPAAPEASPAAP